MARNMKRYRLDEFADLYGWWIQDNAYHHTVYAKGPDRIWVRWTRTEGLSGADYFADGITAEVVTSKGGAARWETIRDWFVNGRAA